MATLVYIYGPPAAGKLTIAEQVAELTGAPRDRPRPLCERALMAEGGAGPHLFDSDDRKWGAGPEPDRRLTDPSRDAHVGATPE
jgi:hypothetical protein